MTLAQQLYEGISLGRKGPVGLITYMRTDSTRISPLATEETRGYVAERFGTSYIPSKPNVYSAGKNAQDAHEAIRPTSVLRTPEEVEPYLTGDQLKLYTLIWQRFVACQMSPAVYDTLTVGVEGGKRYACRASGSVMKFPGFTAIYAESSKKEKDVVLPELSVGDVLDLSAILPEQHFTEPPARYNDATLVKLFEESGIGRPSTYATIITTIISRNYVKREGKSLAPTPLGEITTVLLEKDFPEIVDRDFTAQMEDQLDGIENGGTSKNGRFGRFLACPNYPECRNTKAVDKDGRPIEKEKAMPVVADFKCEICGGDMIERQGKYGSFYACANYPTCRFTKQKTKEIDTPCPVCGSRIVIKFGRGGRKFYSCVRYPECDFSSWDLPLAEKCPDCGGALFYRRSKNLILCRNKDCGYKREEILPDTEG